MNACHTFKHQNIFLKNINKNSTKVILDKEKKDSEISNKISGKKIEMAPIKLPKKTEKVQMLSLQKNVKVPNTKKYNLKALLNLNEKKLLKILGKSNFIKEEGKLKNYQYHFKECFIDVFLLKKNKVYLVNYIEKRPTKLNGKINIRACYKEIKQKLN